MPAIITKGAFSAQGYGFGASAATGATYIEDVFSTYLYNGNSSTQTIANGINLSTKGGLIWIKTRNFTESSLLVDTARGANYALGSDRSGTSYSTDITSFLTNGFSLGYTSGNGNEASRNYASWTFRKQPKFFDIVTYTGTGSARTIAHNLGSVPGMVIVKRTDAAADWAVYHIGLTSASYYLSLNTTTVQTSDTTVWNGTGPTSSVFSVGTSTLTNASGGTYVAYIYAHNAGGFGAAGTDNVISCGSFTAGSPVTVNLGYEPQYVLLKRTDNLSDWLIIDVMRGFCYSWSHELFANTAGTENTTNTGNVFYPTATGFTTNGLLANGGTYIYMAIRRGPMKTPTDATKVFSPILSSAAVNTQLTTGFRVDAQFAGDTLNATVKRAVDRLRGVYSLNTVSVATPQLQTTNALAEDSSSSVSSNWNNTGFAYADVWGGGSSYPIIYWNFQRAPGFFDEVCYTGTGAASQSVTHNLGVTPEFFIIKCRIAATTYWQCYHTGLGFNGSYPNVIQLNIISPKTNGSIFVFPAIPTSSVFNIGASAEVGGSGRTYVAYLFATLAGVSKVGSYTGTGAAQNIDCGFAASARFILIKRADSAGDWYVYDSARGISASNDPYLFLNSTAAEVTNTNYVGTYASGFALTSTAPAELNANGGSFIFLAVA